VIHLLDSGHSSLSFFRATTHVKATSRAVNCRQRGFVVSIDSLLDVWHTAVANLDCITVEHLV
jgi:hypothetical protein